MNIHIVCPHCGQGWDDKIMAEWRDIIRDIDAQLVGRADTEKGSVNLIRVDNTFFLIVIEKGHEKASSCQVLEGDNHSVIPTWNKAVHDFVSGKDTP